MISYLAAKINHNETLETANQQTTVCSNVDLARVIYSS